MLANHNRLAGTKQTSRPVNKAPDYFLGRIGHAQVAGLRTKMVQRLIRMKALDSARLQGRLVVASDGTGLLVFDYPQCEHCVRQQHGDKTPYMHQVLEAKRLGPADTVVSIGSEFVDNRDSRDTPADASSDKRKQDCELKAFRRLVAGLRGEFPPLQLCFTGDRLL